MKTSQLIANGRQRRVRRRNRHLAVALAVTQSTFFYETATCRPRSTCNGFAKSSYDTELATAAPWRREKSSDALGPADLRVRASNDTVPRCI